jgi:hypothetical protein
MNLKKEYTINNTPNAIRYPKASSMGKSFQKIIAKPNIKYKENINSPKTNRNRFAGDFCSF